MQGRPHGFLPSSRTMKLLWFFVFPTHNAPTPHVQKIIAYALVFACVSVSVYCVYMDAVGCFCGHGGGVLVVVHFGLRCVSF